WRIAARRSWVVSRVAIRTTLLTPSVDQRRRLGALILSGLQRIALNGSDEPIGARPDVSVIRARRLSCGRMFGLTDAAFSPDSKCVTQTVRRIAGTSSSHPSLR